MYQTYIHLIGRQTSKWSNLVFLSLPTEIHKKKRWIFAETVLVFPSLPTKIHEKAGNLCGNRVSNYPAKAVIKEVGMKPPEMDTTECQETKESRDAVGSWSLSESWMKGEVKWSANAKPWHLYRWNWYSWHQYSQVWNKCVQRIFPHQVTSEILIPDPDFKQFDPFGTAKVTAPVHLWVTLLKLVPTRRLVWLTWG